MIRGRITDTPYDPDDYSHIFNNDDFIDFVRNRGNSLPHLLQDQDYQDTLAAAYRRGNSIAQPGTAINDLFTLPYDAILRHYGREVAELSGPLRERARYQDDIRGNNLRTNAQVAADNLLAITSGGINTAGATIGTGLISLGDIQEYRPDVDNSYYTALGINTLMATNFASEWINSWQSYEIQERQRLKEIEGALFAQDSRAQAEEEIASGSNYYMARAREIGRNYFNSGEALLGDAGLFMDATSTGLGSLLPSSRVASLGRAVGGHLGGSRSQIVGAALGIGISEASGTLQETVLSVLEMDFDYLSANSPAYNELIASGIDPERARTEVALAAGREAFIIQLPIAAVAGLAVHRFETSPIASFFQTGLRKNVLDVGLETAEEGIQELGGEFSSNVGIRRHADQTQDIFEGLGEAAAEGMVAGAGMAGVVGAPGTATNAARAAAAAASALVADTNVVGRTVREAGSVVAEAGRGVAGAVSERAGPAVSAVRDLTGTITENVIEYANRPSDKDVARAVETSVEIGQLFINQTQAGQIEDSVAERLSRPRESVLVSEGLTDVAGSGRNLIENVTGVIAKIGSRDAELTEEDYVFAASLISELKSVIPQLTGDLRNRVSDLVGSKVSTNIMQRAEKLDLNVTPSEDIATNVNVAKVNPANVNPEIANRIIESAETRIKTRETEDSIILEESGEDISPEDLRILKAASEIAQAINDAVDVKINIRRDENIELTRQERPAREEFTVENTSRSILADGYTDRAGKSLRSINDFARDIMLGLQTEDGMLIGEDGVPIHANKVIEQFHKFLEHMNRKVEALNESLEDSYQNKHGNTSGRSKSFSGLDGGVRFISKNLWKNPVRYSASSPSSVAFARQVEADRDTAGQVFYTLKKAFPEAFEGVTDPRSVPLKAPDQAILKERDGTKTVQEKTKQIEEQTPTPKTDEELSTSEATAEEGESDESADILNKSIEEKIAHENSNTEKTQIGLIEDESVRERVGIVLNSVFIKLGLPRGFTEVVLLVKAEKELPGDFGKAAGIAFKDTHIIALNQKTIDALIDPDHNGHRLAVHTLNHELGHIIDYKGGDVNGSNSWKSMNYDITTDGHLNDEILEVTKKEPKFKKFFEYAYSKLTPHEEGDELFAEIFGMFMYNPEAVRLRFPKNYEFLVRSIQKVGGSIDGVINEQEARQEQDEERSQDQGKEGEETRGESDEGEHSSDEQSESGEGSVRSDDGVVSDPDNRRVDPKFNETYKKKKGQAPIRTLKQWVEQMRQDPDFNQEVVNLIERLFPELKKVMNDRLQNKVKDGNITQSILKHIQKGRTVFRKFKAGYLVDVENGVYDENVLEMAAIALADFIATASSPDPRMLEKNLEKMGIGLSDISDANMDHLLFGLSPAHIADGIAGDLMRLLHIQNNPNAAIGDIHGIMQGFAKELFIALDKMGYISIEEVTLLVDDNGEKIDGKTQTIRVNTDRMTEEQAVIKSQKGEGMVHTSGEAIFGDTRRTFSIGKKIKTIPITQNRSNVFLRTLEKRAIKRMQDTPFYLNTNMLRVILAIGEDALAEMMGYREDVDEIKNPILRRSVTGKNLSIRRDILELQEVLDALGDDADKRIPIYFPVGVTRVGRHQNQGPNPQNNKLLRALVTPTWATMDLSSKEHSDLFWHAIGQATGLVKAEKRPEDLTTWDIQDQFNEKYREAVDLIKTTLKEDGSLETLNDVLGNRTQEPQIIAALYSVAQMEIAKEEGKDTVELSLSFEMDGLTNGAANMLVNMGQGELTIADYNNFQRIGYFLGKMNTTVTQFFNKKNKDLYEVTSAQGNAMFHQGLNGLKDWQKKQRMAMGRLSGMFGNLDFDPETGEFSMTRDTAKNPMTKINYGSGVQGVALGISEDMLIKFYEMIQDLPEGFEWDTYFYPGVMDDFNAVGLFPPKDIKPEFVFSKDQVEKFRTATTYSLGKILTDATKNIIGEKITALNDLMVFSTNIQTTYQNMIYNHLLEEVAQRLVQEGVIGTTKVGKPIYAEIPQKYIREIEREVQQLGPIFISEEQELAVSSMSKKVSDLELSSDFEERLKHKTLMPLPDTAGVRAIPYLIIGTGDAMMMNLIFGSDGAPGDALGVYDGLDVPFTKLREYASYVNEQVLKSWERDVVSMIHANFKGFLEAAEHLNPEILKEAFNEVMSLNKNEAINQANPQEILKDLESAMKANQARKSVFKMLAVSVDQMAGSNVGHTREGREASLGEINMMIERILNGKDMDHEEDVKTSVEELSVDEVLDGTKFTPGQKKIVKILKELQSKQEGLLGGKTRVVFGTLEQLNQWRRDNLPDDGVVLRSKGQYDSKHNIIFLTTKNPETILHEMVHAMTFNQVLNHYKGHTNEAVLRLENLMRQFMKIDSKSAKVREAQAAILNYLHKASAINKASALNEFMAYALGNRSVSVSLERRHTGILKSMTEAAKKLMRRIMGGLPRDMFSHVVFNTKVLYEPNVHEGDGLNGDGSGGDGDGGGGNGDGVDEGGDSTPPVSNNINYWIQNIKNYIAGLDSTIKMDEKAKVAETVENARKTIDDLRQTGFLENQRDQDIFKAIYGIMLSDMKLNPQAVIALTRVFEHIMDTMTPDMFGNTPEDHQNYSAIMNAFGKYQTRGMSDAIAVMFALSQTSGKFQKVIDQIPSPKGKAAVPGSLKAYMGAMSAFFMQNIMNSLETTDKVPSEVLELIAETLINHDLDREYRILDWVQTAFDTLEKYSSQGMTALAERMRETDENVKETTRNRVVTGIVSAFTLMTNMMDKPGSELNAEMAKRVTHNNVPILSIVPIREFISEIIGTDRYNKNVISIMDKVNAKIAGMRQAYREDLPGIFKDMFKEAPTKEQWTSMLYTFAKSDFTSLVDLNNMQKSMQFLEESSIRNNEINKIEGQISKRVVPYVLDDIREKSKQLGAYMVGKGPGNLLIRNAYAIAKFIDGEFDPELVPLIDRLVSLYAIEQMDPSVREESIQLWQNDPKAITNVIAYIQGLNDAEDSKPGITEEARLNAYKGYIPNEMARARHITIDSTEAENDLKKKGFRKVGIFYGDTVSVHSKSYYVSDVRRQGMFSRGAMQNVAQTYRGVDINTGLSVTGETSGFISGDHLVDEVLKVQQAHTNPMFYQNEGFVPVFAGDGSIAGFEQMIDHDILNEHGKRDQNLALMVGAWTGRQVEEALAEHYNRELVDELKRLWDERETTTEGMFIDIKKSDDPIYREAYKVIPNGTKNYIDKVFGNEGFFIRNDMLNIAVGYREASITDMWSGKTRMHKGFRSAVQIFADALIGPEAFRYLSMSEEATQGVFALAKDNIVVRSFLISYINAMSNVVQLNSVGIPYKQQIQGFKAKMAEVEEYNKNITKRIRLEVDLSLAGDDANKVRIIENRMKVIDDLNNRMTIAPLIEAGAYKELSQGITNLDIEVSKGIVSDFIKKYVDKLPPSVANVSNFLTVAQDTKLYEIANKAAQYGDFIAKSIYYDHLLSQGHTVEQALVLMNEEFVNYSYLPGRTRSYLESMGLTWFMAFKIRSMKIGYKTIRDHPFRALAYNSITDIGSPVQDNLATVLADGRIKYSLGWGMAIRSPTLLPWYNLSQAIL